MTKTNYSLPIAQRIQTERGVKIETSKIHPNNWNPNVLEPKQQEALGKSLEMFTQISSITVRPHPHIEGEYEIIDGEHRYLESLEHYYCDVVTCLLDEEYELYTSASKAHGKEDPVKLSASIKRVKKVMGDRTFLPIPYTKADLASMTKAAEEKINPDGGDFTNMIFAVPTDAVEIVGAALEKIMAEANIEGENPKVRLGRALEYLCADYYGS